MTGPMLRVDDVVVHYGAHPALHGVSLRVDRGQVVGLLGHNGAGKTTLVRAVAGLVRPRQGRIRVGGVDAIADSRAARRLIGVAPQDLAIFPPLTVTENVLSWATLAGVRRRTRRRAVAQALDMMELGQIRDRPAYLLSGGEQRRVHCAMAIVARPPLLLLDEPTVGVDPLTRRAVLGHIAALAAAGTAVLYSTHYLTEIEQLDAGTGGAAPGVEVVILHRGTVLASGDVTGLVKEHSGTAIELMLREPGARGGTAHTVRVPVTDPVAELPAALARLGDRQRWLAGVAIHRPSLEDVFLRLTGAEHGIQREVDDGRGAA